MTTADCLPSYLIVKSAAAAPITYADAPVLDDEGWCVVNGLTLDMGPNMVADIDTLRWRISDYERVEEFLPPTALSVDLTGVRVVPQIDDPVMDYLFDVQAGIRGIDAALDIHWDAADRQIVVSNLSADFGYDNGFELSATVSDVDLSDAEAVQLSAGRAGLTALDLTVRSDWLFQGYVAMPLGNVLLAGSVDPAADVADLKAQGTALIGMIPARILDPASADALRDLIADMPHPAGKLDLELRSAAGIGSAAFFAMALSGPPESFDELGAYFGDLTIKIDYRRGGLWQR